jgi:hypothetical protein
MWSSISPGLYPYHRYLMVGRKDYSNNPRTEKELKTLMMWCFHFHQQNFDTQWNVRLLRVMRDSKPKKTLSSTVFKYGGKA